MINKLFGYLLVMLVCLLGCEKPSDTFVQSSEPQAAQPNDYPSRLYASETVGALVTHCEDKHEKCKDVFEKAPASFLENLVHLPKTLEEARELFSLIRELDLSFRSEAYYFVIRHVVGVFARQALEDADTEEKLLAVYDLLQGSARYAAKNKLVVFALEELTDQPADRMLHIWEGLHEDAKFYRDVLNIVVSVVPHLTDDELSSFCANLASGLYEGNDYLERCFEFIREREENALAESLASVTSFGAAMALIEKHAEKYEKKIDNTVFERWIATVSSLEDWYMADAFSRHLTEAQAQIVEARWKAATEVFIASVSSLSNNQISDAIGFVYCGDGACSRLAKIYYERVAGGD